ncbi:MAG TPA: DUF2267 domain-containing protein [Polyangiaceae bacterium]|nr:DUF2267 domain-containing protein [Polyangiaceae bacterium]
MARPLLRGHSMLSENELVGRLRELAPFRNEEEARGALRATLAVLGEQLHEDERRLIAEELPRELGGLVVRQHRKPAPSVEAFARRVAEREDIAPGRAIEHAEIACSVLGDVLARPTRERLLEEIPNLRTLFEPREEPERVPPPASSNLEAPSDLAEGRPGAERSLAATDSPPAHRHSVARSSDPHARTRLSSAPGLRQEQKGETLASGRPGSRRPISDKH